MTSILGKITVIKRNGSSGSQYPVTSTSCLFGKDAKCEIRIQLPTVSGQECKLEFDENGNFILSRINDEGELFINDEIVQTCATVYHNDVLKIAGRSFRLEYPPNLEKMRIINPKNRPTPKSRLIEKLKQSERRRVSFGPKLSPEQFVANFPPNTPIKKGAIPKILGLEEDTPIAKRKSICRRSARLSPKTPLQDLNVSVKKFTPVNNKDLKEKPLISFDSPVLQPARSTPSLKTKTSRRSRNSFSLQKSIITPKPKPQTSTITSQEVEPKNLIDFDTVINKCDENAEESIGGEVTEQITQTQDEQEQEAKILQIDESEQNKEELQLSLFPPKRTYRRSRGSVGELESSVHPSDSIISVEGRTPISEPHCKSVLNTSYTEFDEDETSPSKASCKNEEVVQEDPPGADSVTTVENEAELDIQITQVQKRRSSRSSTTSKPMQTLTPKVNGRQSLESKSAYEMVKVSRATPEQDQNHSMIQGGVKKTSTPRSEKKAKRRSRKSFKTESEELLQTLELGDQKNVEENQQTEVSSSLEKDITADIDAEQVTKSTATKRRRSGRYSAPAMYCDEQDVSLSVNAPEETADTEQFSKIQKRASSVTSTPVGTAVSIESASSTEETDNAKEKNPIVDLSLDLLDSPSAGQFSKVQKRISSIASTPVGTAESIESAATEETDATKEKNPVVDLSLDLFNSPSDEYMTTKSETPVVISDTPTTATKKMTPAALRRRSIRNTRLSLAQQLSPNLSATGELTPAIQKEKKTPSRKSGRRSRSYGATRKALPLWSEVVKKNALKQPVLKQMSKTKNVKETNKQKLLAYGYMTPEQKRALRHVDSPATIYIGRATRKRGIADVEAYSPYEFSTGGDQSVDLGTPKQNADSVEEHYGTKRLFKTPRAEVISDKAIQDIKQLMKTPNSLPVQDPQGLTRLFNTPKEKRKSAEVTDHFGTKRLLKTPKEKKVAQEVETNLGLKRLLKTPRPAKNKEVTEHFGTRRLLKTPREKKKNEAVEDHFGTRRLLRTPKVKKINEPVHEHFGIKRLLKTPKDSKPENLEVTENFGTERLLKTPKEKNKPVEKHFGIKRMMKTPREKKEGNREVTEHFGTKRLMKTPKQKVVYEPVENNFGLRRLMKTPRASEKYQEVVEYFGLDELMRTPRETLEMELMEDSGTEQKSDASVSDEIVEDPNKEVSRPTELGNVEEEKEEASKPSQKITTRTKRNRVKAKVDVEKKAKKPAASKAVPGKRLRNTRSSKPTEEGKQKKVDVKETDREVAEIPARASRASSTRQTKQTSLIHVPESEEKIVDKVSTRATRSTRNKGQTNLAPIDEDNIMTFQETKKPTRAPRSRSTQSLTRSKKPPLPPVQEAPNENVKKSKENELKTDEKPVRKTRSTRSAIAAEPPKKAATKSEKSNKAKASTQTQNKQRTTKSKAQKPAADVKINLEGKDDEEAPRRSARKRGFEGDNDSANKKKVRREEPQLVVKGKAPAKLVTADIMSTRKSSRLATRSKK